MRGVAYQMLLFYETDLSETGTHIQRQDYKMSKMREETRRVQQVALPKCSPILEILEFSYAWPIKDRLATNFKDVFLGQGDTIEQ